MKLAQGIVDGKREMLWVSPAGYVALSRLASELDPEWTTVMSFQSLMMDSQQVMDRIEKLVQQSETLTNVLPIVQPDRLLAPVANPSKIVCVGLNYRPHAKESAMEIPDFPVLFNKFPNALLGSGETIHSSPDGKYLDYEAELVMVMGRSCANVSENEALDYVLGYCNGNDISARDLQFRTGQWLLGKTGDGFGPLGPYLVTADEVLDPDNLEIIGKRNGVVVQHSNTREMIFSVRYLISYLSRYMTLAPGDVIFTGTPEGVILGYPESERKWLQPGEQVSVAIAGLGELVNDIGEFR